jgi:hypothetical protein
MREPDDLMDKNIGTVCNYDPVVCQALLRISLAINARLEVEDVLDRVVHYTRQLMHCDESSILLWNPHKLQFEEGASTNLGQSVAQRVRREGGTSRWIVDHGEPLVMADTHQDPLAYNPMVSEHDIRAYAGVPIKPRGQAVGVLYALSHQVREFDRAELEIMQTLADMAGIAINNALLVQSLRELNEFKKAMMRMAAHDLRNPLSLVKGYIEFLVDDLSPLSPEHKQWAGVIQRSLTRMGTLIDGILVYEKMSSIDEIVRQPCDLNEIARQAVGEFSPAAAEKAQHLGLETTSEPLIIQGDPYLLAEMVGNLISNAIKYTPSEGHITVGTQAGEREVMLWVQDTGSGITPEDQEKIFHPFVRVKSAGSQRGSGLGLSLVKLVVERHGGRVDVESAPGEGSTFRVHLAVSTLEPETG